MLNSQLKICHSYFVSLFDVRNNYTFVLLKFNHLEKVKFILSLNIPVPGDLPREWYPAFLKY